MPSRSRSWATVTSIPACRNAAPTSSASLVGFGSNPTARYAELPITRATLRPDSIGAAGTAAAAGAGLATGARAATGAGAPAGTTTRGGETATGAAAATAGGLGAEAGSLTHVEFDTCPALSLHFHAITPPSGTTPEQRPMTVMPLRNTAVKIIDRVLPLIRPVAVASYGIPLYGPVSTSAPPAAENSLPLWRTRTCEPGDWGLTHLPEITSPFAPDCVSEASTARA